MPDFTVAELFAIGLAFIVACGVSLTMSLPWMGAAFGTVAALIIIASFAKYLDGK